LRTVLPPGQERPKATALRSRLVGSTGIYPTGAGASFTLERALQGVRAAGLTNVELFGVQGYCEHFDVNNGDTRASARVSRLFADYGLTPVALNVAAELNTERGVTHFRRAAAFAEQLGARMVVMNAESVSDETSRNAFFGHVPDIVAVARRHGVMLALEIHGGLISTLADGARLVERIGSEHVRVAYDIANVVRFGSILPEVDLHENAAAIEAIAYVHLKDRSHLSEPYFSPAFGEGVIDFPVVLDLLERGGYRGLLGIESRLDGKPTSPEVVDVALRRSVTYLERIWTTAGNAP